MASGPPRHGREDEFQRVAIPHLAALYNLALGLTRERRDAEDLVQDTYLRAYRFFDRYTEDTQIRAWLFRILRNTFINRYRAARQRPAEVDFDRVEAAYERIIDAEFLREREPATPEDEVLAGVVETEVREALGALPEEYRTVVHLALVEDLSYREVAEVLGIPVGTVMSRLHRGRRLLQASLLEYARKKGILRGGAGVPPSGESAT
jgi:RNA polymerase sigma-70 factor (ECF subfamily)